MHIIILPNGTVLVGIYTLWGQDKVITEVNVAPESLQALHNITGVELKDFAGNDYFITLKAGSPR